MSINIPNVRYLNNVQNILYSDELAINRTGYDFNTVRRKLCASEALTRAMKDYGISKIYEISSGTSDLPAWSGWIDQAKKDIANPTFYREYTPAKGNVEARRALAYMESCKLAGRNIYTAEDLCLTEGSTGAITCTLEYFKNTYPSKEVLIASPNYYIYTFGASYLGMNAQEVTPTLGTPTTPTLTVDALIDRMTKNTKLIVLTNPTNPTGQIYPLFDLKRLLTQAKKANCFVLVDELFAELVFPNQSFTYADQIAEPLGALKNLIIVKGFSKTKNLPGFRIGYAFSKNRTIMDGISVVSQQRQCFPVGSTFTGLICLDALIQSVQFIKKRTPPTDTRSIIATVKRSFPSVSMLTDSSIRSLTKQYNDYLSYYERLMKEYSGLYLLTYQKLQNDMEWMSSRQAAFNTFVKIHGLTNINYFDFMVNLYITTGVKIEFGPCFGLTQTAWETNPNLGFCLRITYAKDKQTLETGIKKFLAFTKVYMKNRDRFISTGLSFPIQQ